jgi:hypothetical protein
MLASSKIRSVPGVPSAAPVITTGSSVSSGQHLEAALQHVGDHAPDLAVQVGWQRRAAVAGRHGGRGCGHGSLLRHGSRSGRRGHDLGRGLGRGRLDRADAEAGGVQAAERLVERGDLAGLGVVGEQREDVAAVAEHVLGETLQGALGADLDEHAHAAVVQGVQALDELHRGGDLAGEDIQHLGDGVRPHRVELTADIGHDRQARWRQAQPGERPPQRLAGGRDDRGVEGVAHRQRHALVAGGLEGGDRPLDRMACPANHGLVARVEVGDDHVAVDAGQDPLDLFQGGEHGRHAAVVGHRHPGHLAAAGADRLQRVRERQRPGGDQRAVLAKAVAHDHVGRDAVGGQ